MMFPRLNTGAIRSLSFETLDLRSIAEPIAVLSPAALIVGLQEPVMALVAALFVLHSWRVKDFSWAREGWFAALLSLWAYALVRTIIGHANASGSLIALQWIHFPIYAAALARWILPDEASRNRLLLATAGALTFYAADCLLQYFVGRDIIGRPAWNFRLTSVSGKPGVGIQMAWLILPPVLGLWQTGHVRFAIFLGLLCSVAVLLSGDRMALLLLLSYAVLMALILRRVRKPLLIALPVVAAVWGSILYFSPTMYNREVESTAQVINHVGQSAYGVVFESALEMTRDHLIFGVGIHNYQAVCLEPKYGPEIVGPEQLPRCLGHPHNPYLEWLSETGIVGFALFVAFVVLSLANLVQAAPRNRNNLIFFGLAASLAMRFWPLSAGTSFFSTWSVEPLFLVLGWSFAYCPVDRTTENEDGVPAAAQPKACSQMPL
jgi:O-antigen ligase